MGIQSQWYNNEKALIYSELSEPWDWDDVQENMAQLLQMAQAVPYPLGLIVLLPSDLSIPPSGFAQSSRAVAQNHVQADFHKIVYIAANHGIKTLWEETINTLAPDPSRYHVVGSLEEALDLFSN